MPGANISRTTLLRDKGFAATVILTLAFCLEANTATFAIVNSVLLRPLSMPDADRIVVTANRYSNAGVPDSNQSSSGDYFDRLRTITALQKRGRYFTEHDSESSLPVILIDERLAQHFWPNRNPVGQRMYRTTKPNAQTDANTKWLTVAGVVRSVRLENLAGTGNATGAYYFPYAQAPSTHYTSAIKTKSDPVSMQRAAQAAVAQVDPELALFDIRTMSERAELSVSSRRTSMILSLGFGIAALLLSATGIYGVLAYRVTQRRREIGIRVALGSTSAGVVRLVVRDGLTPVIAGLIVGFLGAVVLQKAIATQIYGVQPLDPLVMASVILLLGTIAAVGCFVPARRALQVDAVTVLNAQ